MPKKNIISLLLFLLAFSGLAQENVPLQRDIVFTLDKYLNRKDAKVFTALKPYNKSFVDKVVKVDSAITPGCRPAKEKERWFKRKIFREDLFVVNYEDFHLYVSPLFNFGYGLSLAEKKSLYFNTRGVQLRGTFGKKIYFITSYYETQARFPDYVTDFIKFYEVAPGNGRVKDFKIGGYDYGTAYGLISFTPEPHWNIQFGFDKNFIGDGYRSLLLSDNSYQYPFLKIFVNYDWFYYQTIFTAFQNLNTANVLNAPFAWDHGYQTKPGTFNYAGFRIGKTMELGLFEGIIWKAEEGGRKFNWNSMIPVILVNTVHYSLFDQNNVVLGLTAKYKPLNTLNFYGQLMIDNLKISKIFKRGYQSNAVGIQLGGKWVDMFGLQNLNMQIEYNQVRPFAYSSPNPLQSYSHYNQALAHPLGANFREIIAFMNYRFRRIFMEAQLNYAMTGLDDASTNWGQNIFLSQTTNQNGYNSTGNYITQGIKTDILNAGIRAGYLFNPKTNLVVEAGYNVRKMDNANGNRLTHFFYFGLKTSLTNMYNDF
ncbi:MAG TPA: hypothetical protein PKN48_15755 [Bacteroidales bacterium]|nr:hypothetical protein [Bacteroidales bacterium]